MSQPKAITRENFAPVTSVTAQDIDCRPSDNKLMWNALRFAGNDTCEFHELPGICHRNVWPAAYPYTLDFIQKWL